jgi:hypothetical protein
MSMALKALFGKGWAKFDEIGICFRKVLDRQDVCYGIAFDLADLSLMD